MSFERIVSAFCLGWGIVLFWAGWNRMMKDDFLEADKLFAFAALWMIAAGTWWR